MKPTTPFKALFAKAVAAPGLVLTLILVSGCAIEPWVKPYQRHHFADPIMSADRDPVASAYIHHVYQAREGARGAEGGSGGGCGCN